MNLRNTLYWQIFNDIWNLFKRNMPTQNSDEYWETVVGEGNAIYKKYENVPENKFARGIITEIICELERVSKNGEERKRDK